MVRVALAILRGLVLVKRHTGPVLKAVSLPFLLIGRFLLSVVGIPLYRGYFFLRRLSGQILGVAERRLSFLVTNSRLIHVAAAVLAAAVIGMNVTAGDVRAESFGRQSILYHLVSVDETTTLETETAIVIPQTAATSYRMDPSVGAFVETGEPTQDASEAPVPVRSETIEYHVIDGDTLGGIADQFGLKLNTILWANNLTSRSTIRLGLALRIPPEDGVLYTVKKGDTVGKIAAKLGAEIDRIQEANSLVSNTTLTIGSELFIPGGEPIVVAPPVKRSSSITDLFTSAPSSKSPVVFAPKPTDAKPLSSTRGTAAGDGTWVWPTDWRVITQYFSWKHTGLDVDGDYTTHSYAAADGTVIYAGWRTGYGMTVELDHGNGLITRYSHNSKLYVHVGDVTRAGDLLAQTGSTGRSTGTHLHFEVIKNGKFQNPLEYIR